jgi:Secretion system C-terminal sorting domain
MSPTGELIWQRAITDQRFDNSAYLLDAINTPDGGILATGYIRLKQPGLPWQVWMLKISGNGCYESDCEDFELFITPSIEAPVSMPQYSLFPNPASNEVYIEGLTGADERQLDIYDEQGRLIQSISSPRSGPIFTGNWPAGVYSFKLLLKNNLFTTMQLLKP